MYSVAKKLRRWFVSLLLSAISLSPVLQAEEPQKIASDNTTVLVFYTWKDYIKPQLLDKFEQEFGWKVRTLHFNSDEERNRQIASGKVKHADITIVADSTLADYIRLRWLSPLQKDKIPNLKYIEELWLQGDKDAYAVPYSWGSIGIAYRKDLLGEALHSWRQLFYPSVTWRKKITMLRDPEQLTGAAMKALGYSINDSGSESLSMAEFLIRSQKPYVHSYKLQALTENNPLVTGEVWISMTYNGDALFLKENYNANIAYTAPDEGAMLWVDYLAILSTSTKKKQAMAFINFLQRPENAAANALYLNYATPNREAKKLLPDEHLKNQAIYPSRAVLEKSEFFKENSPRTARRHGIILQAIENH